MERHQIAPSDAKALRDVMPKFVQACHEGFPVTEPGKSNVELFRFHVHGIPHPREERGGWCFDLGAISFWSSHPEVMNLMAGKTVSIGEQKIRFDTPIPNLLPVVGGVELKWKTAPVIVSHWAAEAIGVSITRVLVFPDHAEAQVARWKDQVWDWS